MADSQQLVAALSVGRVQNTDFPFNPETRDNMDLTGTVAYFKLIDDKILTFDFELQTDGESQLQVNSAIFNRLQTSESSLKTTAGAHFYWLTPEENNRISGEIYLERPHHSSTLDFNYKLDFTATERFSELLGVSLFNVKFLANTDQTLDARLALQTLAKRYEMSSTSSLSEVSEDGQVSKEFGITASLQELGDDEVRLIHGTARYFLSDLLNMRVGVFIPDEFSYLLAIRDEPGKKEVGFRSKNVEGVSRSVGLLLETTEITDNHANLTAMVNWRHRESDSDEEFVFCVRSSNVHEFLDDARSSANLFEFRNEEVRVVYKPRVKISGSLIEAKSEAMLEIDDWRMTHEFLFETERLHVVDTLRMNSTIGWEKVDKEIAEKARWSTELSHESNYSDGNVNAKFVSHLGRMKFAFANHVLKKYFWVMPCKKTI